jgi:inhibitor of cysteine peptidase
MSQKIRLLIISIIVIILVNACTSNKPVILSASDKGKQINLKVGEQIVISLTGNPSTGYSWEAIDLDTTMLEQVGDSVFQSNNPDMIGSDGILTMTFKALQGGTTTLTLVYHRPWETGVDPIDTFTVSVTIK